ncbi:hydrogenase 4 subunit F [Effusibacillus pohliae]|uniref:hydrogenase 4 subunit F n=1 Tax=Effusibacillus pohliae TaxID=232270 RepID=UPI000368EAFB|nr:hydrogenase 4 subunit F [Effusibacillus pohliae]
MGWIWTLLGTPLVTGLLAWRIKNQNVCEKFQLAGAFVTLLAGLAAACQVLTGAPIKGGNGFFYVDALGAFNISLIVLVGFTAALYSIGYMRHEINEQVITEQQCRLYYLWFHLFLFTMLAVSVVDNLGFLWVGIELTTLVSALLVAFYKKGTALEAAWKYLIMGSVGIAFALLGIIFLYLAGSHLLGEDPRALHWSVLSQVAEHLNPKWILVAFLFVLVGFGTKAGFAPMHFWLPDAHSQAPSPVSAVLSGVLLNTALYGIFRVFAIANTTLGGKAGQFLIFFGLLSMAITVPFILVQHDLKRMLAYSSVEHIGIITLGVGIGGTLGLYGAFLHMFNHSMAKSLLFFLAGNINQKYHSKRMDRISGIVQAMPVTGSMFLVATFAIAGAPPFNVFISEFTIMRAGFQAGHLWAAVLFLLLVVLIFAGMVYYVVKMAFGQAPEKLQKKEIDRWSTAALLIPLAAVVVCGLYVPPFLSQTVHQVSQVLQGVHR